MQTLRFSRRSAFTLTELLVVIVIIGVLASLLLSVLSKVRANGDRTQCLNNMRQIGIATLAYEADHDNTLPGPCGSALGLYYGNGTLITYVGPYLGLPATPNGKLVPLLCCPSWKRVAKQPTSASDNIICYAINEQLAPPTGQVILPFGYPGVATPINTARLSALSGMALRQSATATFSTTGTMLLTDADQQNMIYATAAGWYANLPKTPVHDNVRNSIFYDMHAEARPVSMIP